jgi:uncharacterized protein involved in exopolysaccharide biosynthesis
MSPPELEAEQEVDFGRYGRRIARRWWLVLATTAAGAAIGFLLSLGGGTVYRATATLYLGQPLSPSGNAQIQSLATNPSTVGEIVRSRSVVRDVAAKVGVEPGKLRRGVSTKAVSGASAKQGQNPLVEVTVRGPWRRQSAAAANLLADTVVATVSGSYTKVKIDSLKEQLAAEERELAQIEQRIEGYQSSIEGGGLSDTNRLLLVSLAGFAEQRRGQLIESRTTTQQLLTLAENVEASRVVTRAAPTQVAARGKRNSIVVGGLIGLLAGVAAALAWPALEQRRARSA